MVKRYAIGLAAMMWLITAASMAQTPDLFHQPVRLKAAGEYINVDVAHSAPFVYDFNKDGKRDLLVGQFGEGKLRIYLNVGSNEHPVYETQRWFKTEGEFGVVPSG